MLKEAWKFKLYAKIHEELGKEWIVIFRKILKGDKGRKYISISENYKSLFEKGLPVEVRIFEIISEAEVYIGKKYKLPPFTREVVSLGHGRLGIFIPKPVSDLVEIGKEYIVGLRPIYEGKEEKEEKEKEIKKVYESRQRIITEYGWDQ